MCNPYFSSVASKRNTKLDGSADSFFTPCTVGRVHSAKLRDSDLDRFTPTVLLNIVAVQNFEVVVPVERLPVVRSA